MLTQMELTILDGIQAHLRCGVLDAVMPWITLFGEAGIFWILLTLGFLIDPKTRRTGLSMLAALLVDVILCNLCLKPLAARVRPFTYRPELELLVARLSDYSFPSGHTMASFAAAEAMRRTNQRGWIAAMVLSALIGLSRLYLYVHFPTDVLAGAVLGFACGWAGVYFADFVWDFYQKKKKRRTG